MKHIHYNYPCKRTNRDKWGRLIAFDLWDDKSRSSDSRLRFLLKWRQPVSTTSCNLSCLFFLSMHSVTMATCCPTSTSVLLLLMTSVARAHVSWCAAASACSVWCTALLQVREQIFSPHVGSNLILKSGFLKLLTSEPAPVWYHSPQSWCGIFQYQWPETGQQHVAFSTFKYNPAVEV